MKRVFQGVLASMLALAASTALAQDKPPLKLGKRSVPTILTTKSAGAAQARLCPPYGFAILRRPPHHSARFQLTQVASARLSPMAEPNCSTAT